MLCYLPKGGKICAGIAARRGPTKLIPCVEELTACYQTRKEYGFAANVDAVRQTWVTHETATLRAPTVRVGITSVQIVRHFTSNL